ELNATDPNLDLGTLVVEWSAGDKQPTTPLLTRKDLVRLLAAEISANEKIETKLGEFTIRCLQTNTPTDFNVVLFWKPAGEVPPRVNFTVWVKDRAGNVGTGGAAGRGTRPAPPAR